MPRELLAVGAVVALLLLALAATPVVMLRRPSRAGRVRSARGRRVAAWWVAALLPWIAAAATVAVRDRITVSIHGTGELLLGLIVVLAVYALLVVLPVGVIAATAIWALARRRT